MQSVEEVLFYSVDHLYRAWSDGVKSTVWRGNIWRNWHLVPLYKTESQSPLTHLNAFATAVFIFCFLFLRISRIRTPAYTPHFENHCPKQTLFNNEHIPKCPETMKKNYYLYSQEKSYWSWWYVICVWSCLPLARSGWYHLVTPPEPATDLHSQSLEPIKTKNNLYIKHIFTLPYYT